MSLRIPVADGVDLHVLLWGDGPLTPVLLVHGLASNARLWEGVALELAEAGHPVAAVDQRGHGLSSKPDDGYDFGTLCADLLAVNASLGFEAPLVAGQSWGGNVALELAVRHPTSVAGLVLVDGGTLELADRFADWPTCAAALAPPPLLGTPYVDFERMIRRYHADWPETGIQGTLANIQVRDDGTISPWLSREHHMTILHRLWEHRPSGVYADVKAPVEIVVAVDPTNQRWMAGKREAVSRAESSIPLVSVTWIEGDHDLHAQYPSRIAGLIHQLTP